MAGAADGFKRVVVDLTPCHERYLFVQQRYQGAQDSALRLPAQAEQDEVVPGENCVRDLRNDCVIKSDDARKHRLMGRELAEQIGPHLVFDTYAPVI